MFKTAPILPCLRLPSPVPNSRLCANCSVAVLSLFVILIWSLFQSWALEPSKQVNSRLLVPSTESTSEAEAGQVAQLIGEDIEMGSHSQVIWWTCTAVSQWLMLKEVTVIRQETEDLGGETKPGYLTNLLHFPPTFPSWYRSKRKH